jgi:hypothetical protein
VQHVLPFWAAVDKHLLPAAAGRENKLTSYSRALSIDEHNVHADHCHFRCESTACRSYSRRVRETFALQGAHRPINHMPRSCCMCASGDSTALEHVPSMGLRLPKETPIAEASVPLGVDYATSRSYGGAGTRTMVGHTDSMAVPLPWPCQC